VLHEFDVTRDSQFAGVNAYIVGKRSHSLLRDGDAGLPPLSKPREQLVYENDVTLVTM